MQEQADSTPQVVDRSEAAGFPVAGGSDVHANRPNPYVARILQQHLVDDPASLCWTADGTAVFVDISGFTKLSERLARKGREGAEQITEAIGTSFEAILAVAYENGGSLLKFGGDALLMWFEGDGHATRACRATVLMRRVLRKVGRIEVPGAQVTLRMTQGVHTGRFHFFSVGTSHFEFLPVGPAWTRLVKLEHWAVAGEIMVSPETAQFLASSCVTGLEGRGMLLLREPAGHRGKLPLVPRPKMPAETLAHCLSPAVRAHVLAGGGASEHRPVTIAFVHFEGTDAIIERDGPVAAAEALHRLVNVIEAATEKHGVSFLASDVDADGGKLILTAGAPSTAGDDEERMLLALRSIVDAGAPIPIRIGVHRGSVFAGDIGPFYRRTYTVMGDAVNLAARLMAKAEPGHIYATAEVLDRSNTLFATAQLPPFAVKGKAQPVQAWSVGSAQGSRKRHIALKRLPLVGRDAELALVRDALASARSGAGRLIEIVGEAGIGKTRLLETLQDDATDFRKFHASCEAYTASTPYALWRGLLRDLMQFGRDDPDADIIERLKSEVTTRVPDLVPWLPLIAIVLDIDVAPTPEVELLAEANRRAILHSSVHRFLEKMLPETVLIEIDNAHYMDKASAALLSYVAERVDARPWLIGLAQRPTTTGFAAPDVPAVLRIALEPLAPKDALRMVQLASEQHPLHMHVIEVVAQRSGGNPQFLRDLLNAAINSGGIDTLPESAEAAAMARIDGLAPEDRALVRRAAVLGQTFHPRMLSWLGGDDEVAAPEAATWARLRDLFAEETDGYLRFRRSLLRDAAYEGLPYKLRRRLHGAVAVRLEQDVEDPEESAGILSLHYFYAGEYRSAWRYARLGAERAKEVFAHVEAAVLYTRALASAERLAEVGDKELAAVHESLGDAWSGANEFGKASDAYGAARKLIESDPLWKSKLLLKRSKMEEKVGKCVESLRWAGRARKVLEHVDGREGALQAAYLDAWYSSVLLTQGRANDAVHWAERAVGEAEAVNDAEALGAAYFVKGWAYIEQGKAGVEALWKRSLEAYERSGNRERQAGLLANLGAACHYEGRWDEALSYYERAQEASLKIGDLVDAEVTRLNAAEILADRGELTEAETILLESLPRTRALQYRLFLGAFLSVLGRVALRALRFSDALSRLDEARMHFDHVGAEAEVLDVDSRIAECRALMRETDAALDLVKATLSRASAAKALPRVAPLLERVHGYALLQRGDPVGARAAFEASLAAGRTRGLPLEIALTLLALIELDRSQGIEPSPEMVGESESLLRGLKIKTVPPVPPTVLHGE